MCEGTDRGPRGVTFDYQLEGQQRGEEPQTAGDSLGRCLCWGHSLGKVGGIPKP